MYLYIMNEDYFSTNPTTRCNPDYICNNSAYGPIGPDGTYYGYWTAAGPNGCASALWRSAVNARFIALAQALAAHVLPDGYSVDTSPYIQSVVMSLESAASPYGSADGSYSSAGYVTQYQALNAAMAAAFPHTMVVCPNNFCAGPDESQSLEQSLPGNRTASGGPDIFGYSSARNYNNVALSGLTYGQCSYIGLKSPGDANYADPWLSGGTSLIGVVPYKGTIQNTEMIASYGAYYTPSDLFEQANSTLHATHVCWQYIPAGTVGATNDVLWLGTASSIGQWMTNPGSWGGVLDTIYNNTLSNTAYPSAFP
jgi:hypothetical protein